MGWSRWVGIVWALLGLSGCASSHTLRLEQAGPEPGRALAFEVLAAYSVSIERLLHIHPRLEVPRRSRTALDRTSFLDAWHSYGLPSEAPALDFSSTQALFVVTRESAICGVLPLIAVEGMRDALILRTGPDPFMCQPLYAVLFLEADIELTSLVVRVIAVPRQPAPVHVLRLPVGPTGASSSWQNPRAKPTRVRGATVPVPAVGEVTLAELDDGSRVWVAQHENGEITVLAGDLQVPTAAVGGPLYGGPIERRQTVIGAFVPSRWQARARCYNSVFDEFGRPTFRSLRPLDRYEFTRDPADSERLQIGQRRSGERGRLAERPCLPLDDQVYSAYPMPESARLEDLLTVGGQYDVRHTVVWSVDFPLTYPRPPKHH